MLLANVEPTAEPLSEYYIQQMYGTDDIGQGSMMPTGVGVGAGAGMYVGWALVSTVSMAASAYHGYVRNKSVPWALWWGLMGGLFPIITPVIAVAQGYGKPSKA